MLRRSWLKIKALWQRAKSERASPGEIFWAVLIGVFAGCTPALGFHGVLSLGMATLFRKNRLFAWLGSRISNMVFLPFIAIAAVQTSHRLRTGAWASIDREHAIEQAHVLLLDWLIGMIPVGLGLGVLVGAIAYLFAKRRDARARAASDEPDISSPRTPSERPPASSGSTP